MVRVIISFLVLLYLAIPHGLKGDSAQNPKRHVWRGEYENALEAYSDQSHPDLSVYLTMAGEIERASELLLSSDDYLRRGLISFKVGRIDEALKFLENEVDNPCLEGYRLYYRARSYFECSRYPEAVGELEKLDKLAGENPFFKRHPLFTKGNDLFVEAVYLSGKHDLPAFGGSRKTSLLSSRSLFILSKACLEGGAAGEAKNWFLKGIDAKLDTLSLPLFDELLEGFNPVFRDFSKVELLSVAEYAVKAGSERQKAEQFVEYLNKRYPGDFDVKFIRGKLMARGGNSVKALKVFRGIFDSSAPVRIKKDALLEMASLEYRLKRYDKAAEKYRLFGMYYPADSRSLLALDRAARIEVWRKNWPESLRLWSLLRKRGLETAVGRQAALSEAVLRYRQGDNIMSHRILEDLLPFVRGRLEAAVLYWLQRTSSDLEDMELWSERLKRKFPLSFYTRVLKEGNDCLLLIQGESESKKRDIDPEVMECVEEFAFNSIDNGLAADDLLFDHPVYRAYIYLLEKGLLEEAADCGKMLGHIFEHDEFRIRIVYREARSKGLVGLGISLLDHAVFGISNNDPLFILHYPVAYSGIIKQQSQIHGLTADLLLGVIREESRFDRHAVSKAGACGLMQIMPSTGVWLGRKIGNKHVARDILFTPKFSVEAGSWYLSYLLNRFDGSIVGALAAYNAGASRMSRWHRTFKPSENPMIAIELIGLDETRNYVRSVLDAMSVYRSMFEDNLELH